MIARSKRSELLGVGRRTGADFCVRKDIKLAFRDYCHCGSTMTANIHSKLQDIIGTDAGDRGMKPLICPGDLEQAAKTVANLATPSTVVVLSGFPCCVDQSPPTETDGPPGTYAIAKAVAAMGHKAVVVTETCNGPVFEAAMPKDGSDNISLQLFPSTFSDEDEKRFQSLAEACQLLVSCERAGPGKDGICYTMRGINMNEKGLIAPLDRLAKECNAPYIAIGDGGNELGMGKVIDKIISSPKIANGDLIGCVVPADFLIAASVSNWGGYALAAAIAVEYQRREKSMDIDQCINVCLPSDEDEIALLNRCVAAGCRDGVSGKMEATVDGMPLETSLQCLRDLRNAARSTV